MNRPKAIIGGTGFERLAGNFTVRTIPTTYGTTTVYVGEAANADLIFLPRHGPNHTLPPHRVNYRANIKALADLGVDKIIGIATVGSTNKNVPPGSVVNLSQFIDLTHGRPTTFFDGDDGKVVHVDVTNPYCPALRARLQASASAHALKLIPEGVYVCAEGPRLETAAEVRWIGQMGGDVVGMTGVPEAPLARELGLCYASLALVVNWGAGIEGDHLEMAQMREMQHQTHDRVLHLVRAVLLSQDAWDSCRCGASLLTP
jgi:5'-methylthioadenosine phosphorylase